MAFSPDGNTIASSYDYSIVRLRDPDNGTQIRNTRQEVGNTVYIMVFSPDGTTIAGGSEPATVRLWDANNGTQIGTLTDHTDLVHSVSFSLDGKTPCKW